MFVGEINISSYIFSRIRSSCPFMHVSTKYNLKMCVMIFLSSKTIYSMCKYEIGVQHTIYRFE